MNYNYDTSGREDHQSSYVEPEGLLAFPDLLAPAARVEPDTRYLPDYDYPRERPQSHSSSYFDSSSFNVSNTFILLLHALYPLSLCKHIIY